MRQERVVVTGICIFALLLVTQRTFAADSTPTAYVQHNLVSDVPGLADHLDPNLVNPWGISFSATSPFWISDYGTGLTTVYGSDGDIRTVVVTIAAAPGASHPARVTGQVRNGSSGFLVNGKSASFIFATEDGTISGWNAGTTSVITVDNSASGAVYKGLAIGSNSSGTFLYAANFRSGKIDVFHSTWAPSSLAGSFSDPSLPAGFAPFNIQNLGGKLYVTYATQDSTKTFDVPGAGNGVVDVYDTDGNLLQHLVANGPLNSPWGVAIAPASFGPFSNALLVGNFGDGLINAFDSATGAFLGNLKDSTGQPIQNSGLWALQFGNGGQGGDTDTLYFTAGISGQSHGLFGSLLAIYPGEPELRTTLGPGFWVADVRLQPGQPSGEWGMIILADPSYGGFNVGGAFGPEGHNSGFGGFFLQSAKNVTFSLNAAPSTNQPTGSVSVRVLKDNVTEVGTPLTLTSSGTTTLSLEPGFYVVNITGSSGPGVFALSISADSIPLGVIVGGYLSANVSGFGGFFLGSQKRVKILTYGPSLYSPWGAGNFQLTLRDAAGTVRTTVH